jgi:RNA polymerase sigma-70 factor (ECF subfamily)
MLPARDPRSAFRFATLTDDEVVSRVLAGETELFEVLMRRHNQRVFRAARAIVRDDAEAEDVMQESYTRAFAQLAQFQGRAQWSTWLTRIAVNEALGRLRRNGRFVNTDIDDMEETSMDESARGGSAVPIGPEDQVAARELNGFVERAVDALPDIYRSVFVLREVEEMSTAEAADCLGISEELVKVRLHRARAELRRRLDARVGSAIRGVYGFHLTRCDRVVEKVMARITGRLPTTGD